MAKQICLSFKEYEMKIYDYIKGKSSPSVYIKELVERDINKTEDYSVKVIEEVEAQVKEKPKQSNMNLSSLNIGR